MEKKKEGKFQKAVRLRRYREHALSADYDPLRMSATKALTRNPRK